MDSLKMIDYSQLNKYQLHKVNSTYIKNLRETLGLTKTEFGKLFSVSHSQVTNWEKSVSRPNDQTLLQMMQISRKIEEEGANTTGDTLKQLIVAGGIVLTFIWLFNLSNKD